MMFEKIIEKCKQDDKKTTLDKNWENVFEKMNSLDERMGHTPILPEEIDSRLTYRPLENTVSTFATVSPEKIYFRKIDLDKFSWNHHGYNKEKYEELINSYTKVEKLLATGKSLEEISQENPELTSATVTGYQLDKLPTVCRWGDNYIWEDDGRHRIIMAQELGLEHLNVNVKGEWKES